MSELVTIYKDLEQRTEEWNQLRRGSIGGSSVKKAHAKNNFPYAYEVAGERLSTQVKDNFTSEATQRGTDLEPVCIAEFEAITGLKITTVGLVKNKEWKGCHLSPDGLIYEGETPTGAIEMKCPDSKTHIEYIFTNKVPAVYRQQICHNFTMIPSLEKIYFISFDPRVESRPIHIIEVTREDFKKNINEHELILGKFIKKVEDVEATVRDSF